MKLLAISLLVLVTRSCCTNCEDDYDYEPPFEAVYMERTAFEQAVTFSAAQAVETSGKIYSYETYLFVNDVHKGFHVYDNQNPESPTLIGFINAPGATDLAITDGIVYINQATDLIAVALNVETKTLEVTKRIIGTFPEIQAPDGWSYAEQREGSVIVDWVAKDETTDEN